MTSYLENQFPMLRPPTELDWYLESLTCQLPPLGMQEWKGMILTECVEWASQQIVRIGSLHGVDAYRERFTDLVTRGWPWVNLHAVGLLRSDLLLHIEKPTYEPTGSQWTSVNMSGPAQMVQEHRCRLEPLMAPEVLKALKWRD